MMTILLVITATTTALMAGLFYAYTCSVTLGLGRLPDAEYLAAMQSINRAILNPVFFTSFFGTLILLPLSTWLHYEQPVSARFIFLLVATLVYVIGAFGVTVVGNIPLNEALDKFNIASAPAESITNQRTMFEAKWNNLNIIRTLASTAAIVLVILACLSNHKPVPAQAVG